MKKHSGPQIVAKLREADRLLGQGKTVEEVCKEIDVTDATYYRWRQKYGGMSPDMVRQLRKVQRENAQLRKLVADQALDISILKVAAEGNF
jgi:transposase-like protein